MPSTTIPNNQTSFANPNLADTPYGGITIAKSSANIENVIGSAKNDNIKGNDYDNEFDLSAGGNDTVDGKTAAMKVAVALQGDFANLLKLNHNDGEAIGTRERLNEMIKQLVDLTTKQG